MTVPLIVLAVLSTIGGFIGVPYALSSFVSDKNLNFIEQTLEPVIAKSPTAGGHETKVEVIHPPQETDGAPAIHPLEEAAGAAHESHSAEETHRAAVVSRGRR